MFTVNRLSCGRLYSVAVWDGNGIGFNTVAILIMISSGWKIYNDDAIFGGCIFQIASRLDAGRGTACNDIFWHVDRSLKETAHVAYGFPPLVVFTRIFLFPIRLHDLLAAINDALLAAPRS